MYDSLKGKIALVTGATSGIGKEIAKQLCKENVTVIIKFKMKKTKFVDKFYIIVYD